MESKTTTESSDRRFALLIDADNAPRSALGDVMAEVAVYGTPTIKRIYGDWTLTLHAKWKDALLENSITPIQQFGYTQGKNATDSAMIIDAMDILYSGNCDGFVLVSSDSDFTRLASRLRESGRMVIGMGEKKTPTPFRRACDVFTTLELLVQNKRNEKGGGSNAVPKDSVEQAVVDIITDNQNNGNGARRGGQPSAEALPRLRRAQLRHEPALEAARGVHAGAHHQRPQFGHRGTRRGRGAPREGGEARACGEAREGR